MTCYRPNFIYKKFLTFEDKMTRLKRHYKKNQKDLTRISKDKTFEYRFIPYNQVDSLYSKDTSFAENLIPIPCGQCIGCRLDYAREWANRCYCEGLYHKYGYFITLTYDNENLPFNEEVATLKTADFKKFIKDLRNYFQNKLNFNGVRYFGCGEYGDKSFRPHYHILIWTDVAIPDLTKDFVFYNDENKPVYINKTSPTGDPYYFSEIISNIWKKGNVIIGQADWRSCCYVSRYVIKKQKGESKKVYNDLVIESPFLRMSNRPGIGYQYYEEHKEQIVSNDYIVCANQDKSFVAKVPRYFNNLVKQDDIIDYFDKLGRDLTKFDDMKDKAYTNYLISNENDKDLLTIAEENANIKLKILKRGL